MHLESVLLSRTVNQHFYWNLVVLRSLRKHRELLRSGDDNVATYTLLQVNSCLVPQRWSVLPHSSHSPDLLTFYLYLKGKSLDNVESTKKVPFNCFGTMSKLKSSIGISNNEKKRFDKCIPSTEQFFERILWVLIGLSINFGGNMKRAPYYMGGPLKTIGSYW